LVSGGGPSIGNMNVRSDGAISALGRFTKTPAWLHGTGGSRDSRPSLRV
jgi:hypothetical protein